MTDRIAAAAEPRSDRAEASRTRPGRALRGLAVLFALWTSGCATFDASIPESLPPRAVLEDTPFFPQLAHHCGPAALATVLGAAGVEPGYDAVVERVYVPGLQGTLQVEMMAAARGYDRIPFRVPGTLEDVLAQVEAGTPVLVLQNLRIRTWPAWHYAVVIGYDRERRRILMRSGTVPELATPVGRWMRQWDWASRWGIVVLRPGELPARPKRANVFRALADFDERGRPEFRLAAWSAAAGRWPGDVLPRVGMANALLALKRSEEAEERYREALVIDAGHWPARLNLANLLLEAGRACEGRETLDAVALPLDHPLAEVHAGLDARLRRACPGPSGDEPGRR